MQQSGVCLTSRPFAFWLTVQHNAGESLIIGLTFVLFLSVLDRVLR